MANGFDSGDPTPSAFAAMAAENMGAFTRSPALQQAMRDMAARNSRTQQPMREIAASPALVAAAQQAAGLQKTLAPALAAHAETPRLAQNLQSQQLQAMARRF